MTTATLPDAATEPRRAGRMLWAETGRCARDHDITDPDNVFVYERDDGRRQVACRQCRRLRDGARQPQYPEVYPTLTCLHCEHEFSKPADLVITLRGWMRREYCSPECIRAAGTVRRLVGDGIDSVDVEWSLAACEGTVRTAADDVFFEPDQAPPGRPPGARIATAKTFCVDCPIRSGCLRYAIDRKLDFGVWGGLDATERRTLVKRFAAESLLAGTS